MNETDIRPLKGIKKVRWALLVIILLSILVSTIIFGNVIPAGGVGVTIYSGSEYTLAEFPSPFVSTNSSAPTTYVILPSSSPHGPCGSAHSQQSVPETFGS